MWIDRFLKLPIKTQDSSKLDLEGQAEVEESHTYILPNQIEEFFPVVEDDTGTPAVKIHTKTGRSFWIWMSEDKFIDVVNKHQA